jgi:NAD(P)-dependent dehydrogenase (short-subunit alcohol dehydrogenase family)
MRNYLIIGASSGIGKRLATDLSETGDHVDGTYYTNELAGDSANLSFHPLDVRDEKIDLDFVPDRLDGIAYCPGAINLRPFTRIKPEDFASDFDLQVGGAIKVIQAVLPSLKASDQASIVLFSTVAVQKGFSFHSQVSASKGAIEGLTRALAAEFAPKIRVNCIAPSLTDTPLAARLINTDDKRSANAARHPLRRIGTPEDIAGMAAFLLSNKSGWMTGQILHVDGGMSALNV